MGHQATVVGRIGGFFSSCVGSLWWSLGQLSSLSGYASGQSLLKATHGMLSLTSPPAATSASARFNSSFYRGIRTFADVI